MPGRPDDRGKPDLALWGIGVSDDALTVFRSGQRPLSVLPVEKQDHLLSWLTTTVALASPIGGTTMPVCGRF
jgi:hypothetical protein